MSAQERRAPDRKGGAPTGASRGHPGATAGRRPAGRRPDWSGRKQGDAKIGEEQAVLRTRPGSLKKLLLSM